MWTESAPAAAEVKSEKKGLRAYFTIPVFALTFCLMLYVEYVSNISSMEAAKRINYGYSYALVDMQKAANYFDAALSVRFNLDPRDTANRYSDFAVRILNSDLAKTNQSLVAQQIDKATQAQLAIAEKTQNDPILWMHLANDEMVQAIIHNQSADLSKPAIAKAIALAPKRVELLQLQLQLDGYKKDWADAALVAEKITSLNPYSPELKWQLAMAYYLNGRIADAVKTGDAAIAAGFKFTQLQQFAWYIQYYEQKQDYQRIVPLLEQAITLEPNEIGLYVDLAKAYANIGDKDHARALAEQVIISDPTQKAAMEAFIQSLK
jgi:FimV-like protein